MAAANRVYRGLGAWLTGLLILVVQGAQAGESQSAENNLSDAARAAGHKQPDSSADEIFSQRLSGAELVAKVKITGVHRMIDQALSEPGMVAILGYVYSGVAEKIWKGAPANLIAFRLTLDDCDRKLRRGEHYLIFAEVDTDGRLQLSSCEAAVTDADAGKLLVKLDHYYQG